MNLSGKVAIVTGAAGDIGGAVAREMASQGAAVLLSDSRGEPLERTVRELRARGFAARASVADVTTTAGNQDLVASALESFGRIDVFHANAGVAPFEDLLQVTPASVARTIDVNLKGAIYGCTAVLPAMIAQRHGVILLTASVAAFVGDPAIPVYGATKAGLTGLCKSIAVRHGPEGIRCNTICPGDVQTQMLEDYLALDADPAEARRQMIERYPLRRLAEPEDIARLAAFLASDAAGWITGADIVIDGGLTARCY
jgi:NAD(P)-dependent dehydrogenase (short-subunit alcohol dehydrogenase family)